MLLIKRGGYLNVLLNGVSVPLEWWYHTIISNWKRGLSAKVTSLRRPWISINFTVVLLCCCLSPCWITKLNHKRGRMQCYQKVWHIKLYDFYRPLSSYGPSFGQNTFCMNCLYLKVKPDVFSATSNGQNIISDVRKNLHLWLNYTKKSVKYYSEQHRIIFLAWDERFEKYINVK